MRENTHAGIIHVLGVPSPQNTVGHDTIENIEFPSFLINSPEVKMSVPQSTFGFWSLETLEGSIFVTMTPRAQCAEN